jgi:glutathione S-transferase
MSDITLYIGNKNYSSWSLRAWLAMKATGEPFHEEVLPIEGSAERARIRAVNPAGRVPVMHRGSFVVWDSLAIAETLAEWFPRAHLWPEDRGARVAARSACAEMHAGFQGLRTCMPMNIRGSYPGRGRTPESEADASRILELWRDLRGRFGRGGPFLFGQFGIPDAFYAPVVTRFRTYGVTLDGACEAYAQAILAHPPMAEWCEAARAEPWVIDKYEHPAG